VARDAARRAVLVAEAEEILRRTDVPVVIQP